jgi:hypothetical protein
MRTNLGLRSTIWESTSYARNELFLLLSLLHVELDSGSSIEDGFRASTLGNHQALDVRTGNDPEPNIIVLNHQGQALAS